MKSVCTLLVLLLSSITVAKTPAFAEIRASYVPSEARLVDRNGAILQERRVDPKSRRLGWVRLADISPILVKAVIYSEDRNFERHHGVDWWAAIKSVGLDLLAREHRGASTLTMQLAGLLDPTLRRGRAPRGIVQKLEQMQSARALEKSWSKNEILEAYLNLVTFRGEIKGIGAASRGLFDKEPQGLSTSEAMLLAALLRSPNAPQSEVTRRACVLARDMSEAASCNTLSALASRVLGRLYQVRPLVSLAPQLGRELLKPGGPGQVRTTLVARVQRFTLRALEKQIHSVHEHNVDDAAALVVDNRTGRVLAYVGSVTDFSRSALVDGVLARRQAGSSLKPFLYATAFDLAYLTPASLILDSPVEMAAGNGLYRPSNYDHIFHGEVTAREALASSLNIPAVKTLSLVGVEAFYRRLVGLGFSGLESPEFYGPSLALGSADVSLWDLVAAYRALAERGRYRPLTLIPGALVDSRKVFSPEAAFLVADILSDRASRNLTFGLESPLATHSWSAVKTGTSKDMRDNWCVGFSDRYTVGVWVGNFSGAPMWNVSGITGAAPAWVEIMNWLHEGQPSRAPVPPARLIRRGDWFVRGTEPRLRMSSEARAMPRILSPMPGTIIALDPDIPSARQRVFFEAETGGQTALSWQLDGKLVGPADKPFPWPPAGPGGHRLMLVDASQHPLDEVTFDVRGHVADE